MLYLSIRYMAAKRIAELERLFQALGDATRLRILGLLLTGEICVCDIHETLKIPQPKASRHLAYLRRAGPRQHASRGPVGPLPAGGGRPTRCSSAIAVAVRHGLTHLDVVRQDAERLQKKTGCCMPRPRCDRRTALLRTGEPWPRCQLIAPGRATPKPSSGC